MHLISQRFYNCINKFSIEKAIQKFMEPALRAYNYESEKALNAYSQNEKTTNIFEYASYSRTSEIAQTFIYNDLIS